MQKGVSIFYEFHDQGCPHVIAGIYSPYMKTEEEMRTQLLSLIGHDSFHERDEPIFVNHTHVYAKSLLGEEMDKELTNLFNKFFPQALNPNELPVSPMKFYHTEVGAYEFIWNNRYSTELHEHRVELQRKAAEEYRRKRAERKHQEGE
ncbi:hypothetical protein [Salmonella enterica]|uniref:hypothetical protein n=1 Tax=Salmonella enterica TaxID=28901 RepID=UPI003A810B79